MILRALFTTGRLLRYAIAIGGLFTGLLLLIIASGERGTGERTADCGIVFGSAVYGWNTPGPAMHRRVNTAVRLAKEGAVKKFVFTGGRTTSTDQTEAAVMLQLARKLGMDTSTITLETKAQSTWQNLRYSRPLLEDCEDVLGISDGYHLARIRFGARLQGWGIGATVPADETPTFPAHMRSVLREFLAILYYAFMGPWLDETAAYNRVGIPDSGD